MQYGNGLASFGRMLYRFAKPLLSYLGKQTLKAGVSVGSDVMAGDDIKASLKRRAKESGAQIVEDAASAVKKKLTGQGRMARRRRRTGRKRAHKKPTIRRRKTVRRKRATRKRVKKALADIFT